MADGGTFLRGGHDHFLTALFQRAEGSAENPVSYIRLFGMAVFSALCGLLPPMFIGWVLFAFLCSGLGTAGNVHTIPLTAYTQETAENEKMGRALSVLTLISSITMPVGLLFSSPIAEKVGVQIWFFISCTAMTVMTGTALLQSRKNHQKGGEKLD